MADFVEKLTLKDICDDLGDSKPLVTINGNTTVEEALKILKDNDILSVPVVDDDKKDDDGIVGILNILDLAIYISFQGYFNKKELALTYKTIDKLTMSEFLETMEDFKKVEHDKELQACFKHKASDLLGLTEESKTYWHYPEDTKLSEILDCFALGVHRIIVTTKSKDGEKVKRMVTQSDLCKFFQKNVDKLPQDVLGAQLKKLKEFKKSKLIVAKKEDTALFCFRKLGRDEMHGIAIVDDEGHLQGTISASDLRGITAETMNLLLLPVGDFLKKMGQKSKLVALSTDFKLKKVIEFIVKERTHRVFIVEDNNKLKDILSLSDIHWYICSWSQN